MIVSRMLDTTAAPVKRVRSRIPVQRSVPGSDVVSAVPPQKPNFNVSKGIATKLIYDPVNPICAKGGVPLKCNQLGSHAEGAMLFNAPVLLIPAPLLVPKDVESGFSDSVRNLIDDVESAPIMFPPDFRYNDGIRSSRRPLHFDPISEPADPYPDRIAGRPAPFRFQKTTYDVGTIALQQMKGSI